jgi:hypothetical protein
LAKAIILGLLGALFVFFITRRMIGKVPAILAGAVLFVMWLVVEGSRHGG